MAMSSGPTTRVATLRPAMKDWSSVSESSAPRTVVLLWLPWATAMSTNAHQIAEAAVDRFLLGTGAGPRRPSARQRCSADGDDVALGGTPGAHLLTKDHEPDSDRDDDPVEHDVRVELHALLG
jgi:hypothetical protein